jgi:hypothetical protein
MINIDALVIRLKNPSPPLNPHPPGEGKLVWFILQEGEMCMTLPPVEVEIYFYEVVNI